MIGGSSGDGLMYSPAGLPVDSFCVVSLCHVAVRSTWPGGIQDGGRISRLIATTARAHPQTARGFHSPAKAVRLQHRPLRVLHGFLVAPARIVAATASTGGPRKKMRAQRLP
ncbi:hypothetical protein NDU88_007410 [Pleurodeles waltl]|uniref:Uncharacterized protein n=1 Tax=Pleurodeles waltl TaxID=8319 RepID=A0AAV7VST7_PLEWA|nr:hypothetical protein NDU88_007410 [Pleurodeles waltl]